MSTKMREAALVGIAFDLIRDAVDMTQREVAREVGMSPSQLGRIERGETHAWDDQYTRLVEFYGRVLADRSWRIKRGSDLRLVN